MAAMTSASLTAENLWTRARAMFARALAALGDPAAIAAIATLPSALRRRIVAWLAPLEHIVRKLLLAEAAQMRAAPTWTAALQARIAAPACAREGASEDARSNSNPSTPETWSVRFALSLPRDPRIVADAHAPRIRSLWDDGPVATRRPSPVRQATAEDGAVRLARRLEALRRVLENPRPHALRLARLLKRAIRRFPEVARRYWLSPPRSGDYDPADDRLSLDATAQAADAPHVFEDSS